MIRWGRRRASLWVALVLPGFLLRSLIPIGFMPMFGAGSAGQLVLCEGYAPVPAALVDMPMAMPAGMSMNMPMGAAEPHHGGERQPASGRGSPVRQDHSACPYGASPAFAVAATSAILTVRLPCAAKCALAAPQVVFFQVAPRAQSPRGPPLEV